MVSISLPAANKHIGTYCFESPNLFMTDIESKEKIKRVTLTIKDFNLSKVYKESKEVKIFYTLENNYIYEIENLFCYSYPKDNTYICNHDMDGGGSLEFMIKDKNLNMEELSTLPIWGSIIHPFAKEIDDSMMTYPLTDKNHGYLNTMSPNSKENIWNKKLWIKGHKCHDVNELKIRKIFYTKEAYREKFSNETKQDPLFQKLDTLSTKHETTIHLSQSYKKIAEMMEREGFGSNWINYDDIELFIYTNKTAFIRITPLVKTSSRNTCLAGGYYFIELDKSMLKIRYLEK